ncbi:ABC transporter ATP-binding protein [Mycoplasma sp. NEAQ87857]|uniref:ABC transporter ATP-binding protein n=1 Tax=Mycoplasma sp. NEAQ87857 TaxID=2683967 RepID=UPI00131C52D8|nr:ABC transporter ATP-binding protein [Mycoplasma sp. NEAQ87857]
MKLLLKYFKKEISIILFVVFLEVLAFGFYPYVFKIFVDLLKNNLALTLFSDSKFVIYFALFLALNTLILVFASIVMFLKLKLNNKFRLLIQRNLFNIFTNKGLKMFREIKEGDKLTVLTKVTEVVGSSIVNNFINLFSSLGKTIALTIGIGLVAPITLSYLIPISLVFLLVSLFLNGLMQNMVANVNDYFNNEMQVQNEAAELIYSANVLGINDKVFTKTTNLVKDLNNKYLHKMIKSEAYLKLIEGTLASLSFILILMISIILIFKTPYIDFAILVLIINQSKTLVDSVESLFGGIFSLRAFNGALNDFLKTLHPDLSYDHKFALIDKNINKLKSLNLIDIDFGYDNKTIFNQANLNINQGDKVLIYGESGVGKSSLFDILLGVNNLNNGSYVFNDVPINEQEIKDIYKNYYVSSSEINFYEDTLMNNLILGDKHKINDAISLLKEFNLEQLDVNEMVDLTNLQYSLGQIQRLAIIRALMSDKDILLFDESLSNIDPSNAAIIYDALVKSNKTIILISHTIKELDKDKFNKVYKLEGGKINELLS